MNQVQLALGDQHVLECEESASQDGADLRRWKNGEIAGFNALMGRYEHRLYRVILRIVRNKEDAQDILQETFIRLHGNLVRLREDVSLQPWLFRTASNLAIDHLRKAKPGRTVSLEEHREATGQEPRPVHQELPEDPHRLVLRKQLEERLAASLQHLPKRQRLAMTLRCSGDLSMREIAEVLNCSERTAGTTLFAARKKLMKQLEPLLSDLLHAR